MNITIDGVEGIWIALADMPALPPEPEETKFNASAFFDVVRAELFGGSMTQEQVDGCNLIGSTCMEAKLEPKVQQIAYVLATVFHETAQTMQPIAEYGGSSTRYAPWYGRGHVQLTWEENYQKQEDKLGNMPEIVNSGIPYQVHADKELALYPETSAYICVLGMKDGDFTGVGLSDYINSSCIDYVNARRIVNGTDKADMIAGYAETFQKALEAGLAG